MAVWEIGAAPRGASGRIGDRPAVTQRVAPAPPVVRRRPPLAPPAPPATPARPPLTLAEPARTFARLLGNRTEVGAVAVGAIGGGVATALGGPVIGAAAAIVGKYIDGWMGIARGANGRWIDIDGGPSSDGSYANGAFDIWGNVEIPWSMPPADLDPFYESLGRLILDDWDKAGRPADWCPFLRTAAPGGHLRYVDSDGLIIYDQPQGKDTSFRLGSMWSGPWLNVPAQEGDYHPWDPKWGVYPVKPLSKAGWPTSQPYESFFPFMQTTKGGHRVLALMSVEDIAGIARLLNTVARTAVVKWGNEKTGAPALVGWSLASTKRVIAEAKAGNPSAQQEVVRRGEAGDPEAQQLIAGGPSLRKMLWAGAGLGVAIAIGVALSRRREAA